MVGVRALLGRYAFSAVLNRRKDALLPGSNPRLQVPDLIALLALTVRILVIRDCATEAAGMIQVLVEGIRDLVGIPPFNQIHLFQDVMAQDQIITCTRAAQHLYDLFSALITDFHLPLRIVAYQWPCQANHRYFLKWLLTEAADFRLDWDGCSTVLTAKDIAEYDSTDDRTSAGSNALVTAFRSPWNSQDLVNFILRSAGIRSCDLGAQSLLQWLATSSASHLELIYPRCIYRSAYIPGSMETVLLGPIIDSVITRGKDQDKILTEVSKLYEPYLVEHLQTRYQNDPHAIYHLVSVIHENHLAELVNQVNNLVFVVDFRLRSGRASYLHFAAWLYNTVLEAPHRWLRPLEDLIRQMTERARADHPEDHLQPDELAAFLRVTLRVSQSDFAPETLAMAWRVLELILGEH
ncbi:hypothetical protein IWQ60_006917 [Tieghemiomyces parasiticus]|uniref:Uncharacterized protein n=1 Tax=Tieghemiomyces parasiticus TaxID=78921 RepID=A0A9W8A1D3_9FUNG|nr:hypothetical protein IWQ60_006917 [Tieghemiomyces parasiticus]